MSVIGIDLGGTKLAGAVFRETGTLVDRQTRKLGGRSGEAAGAAVVEMLSDMRHRAAAAGDPAEAAGIAVPGIYAARTGRVWAPNIGGWEDYPLLGQLQAAFPYLHVRIDSDRACSILGEAWQGAAHGSRNAVFLAVGTGIGAGIMADGRVVRGFGDVAGAIGWMGLGSPFREEYRTCGAFESIAAGPGIAAEAARLAASTAGYEGVLRPGADGRVTTADVFAALEALDPVAGQVVDRAVEAWGMALANVVSLLDPEVVIFGGGVFGPAASLLDRIRAEATRWAQPISMAQVRVEASGLGADAALFGAGHLALDSLAGRSPGGS
jgi:glucokinase